MTHNFFPAKVWFKFSELWCKFGVKLADPMFSIQVVDDSEKVNSQTSRGQLGIRTRKRRNPEIRARKQKCDFHTSMRKVAGILKTFINAMWNFN